MTDSQYNDYAERVKEIISAGTKEGLISYYRYIIAQTGDWESVRRIDRYNNDRWNIDFDSL